MSNRSHIRRRRDSDDDDNNTADDNTTEQNSNDGSAANAELDQGTRMEDLKLIQKFRQRKKGLTVEELALGKQSQSSLSFKKSDPNDPLKHKSTGHVEIETIKQQQKSRASKDITTINDNFARETNTRDEDTEMQRYIEEQLARLQQKTDESTGASSFSSTATNDELRAVFATLRKPEDTLFHVSKHLITDHSAIASEEMLSDQMLSGIPEVEIGVDEKIRNIEETDKAKRKLLQTLCDKKSSEKKFSAIIAQSTAPMTLLAATTTIASTPTKTTAVSFVQHKRFNTDGMDILNPKRFKTNQTKDIVKPQPVVGNKEKHPKLKRDPKPPSLPDKPLSETATDDLVFDQFRKNLHGSRNWKIRLA